MLHALSAHQPRCLRRVDVGLEATDLVAVGTHGVARSGAIGERLWGVGVVDDPAHREKHTRQRRRGQLEALARHTFGAHPQRPGAQQREAAATRVVEELDLAGVDPTLAGLEVPGRPFDLRQGQQTQRIRRSEASRVDELTPQRDTRLPLVMLQHDETMSRSAELGGRGTRRVEAFRIVGRTGAGRQRQERHGADSPRKKHVHSD